MAPPGDHGERDRHDGSSRQERAQWDPDPVGDGEAPRTVAIFDCGALIASVTADARQRQLHVQRLKRTVAENR